MLRSIIVSAIIIGSSIHTFAQDDLYQRQSQFTALRFGVMMHFNMGTFTDEEWASPDHDPKKFNPTKLNCNQWADACKAAGMTYGILTAKHHDGFCLWDSQYTDYDVASSSVKTDVVAEYVKAFRSRGLKPCLYFSIWDRHNGIETGGAEQEAFVMNQLTELLTKYGEIPLIIFDGWNWKMGHRLISYPKIVAHIKKLQPNCLVADHNGNSNFRSEIIYYEGPKGVFPPGDNVFASQMALTLTNGWFWHPTSPGEVKPVAYTLDKLQRLEPLYCNFMLNISPNREGLFDPGVVKHLAEVGQRWKPDTKRLPLPQQPDNLSTFIDAKSITASSGGVDITPSLPANTGSPVSSILSEQSPRVMIDGIIDIVGDRGGFAQTQTLWKFSAQHNRMVELDLGEERSITKFYYLPAQLRGYTGVITGYRLSTSINGVDYTQLIEGKWKKNTEMKVVSFAAANARYIRLEILESVNDALISELGVGN